MLNVHELQDPVRGGTKALTGDNDWTQVQLNFNSGQMTEVTINCLFGGWGRATGTAWFDDIELTAAPGSELAGEIGRVVRHRDHPLRATRPGGQHRPDARGAERRFTVAGGRRFSTGLCPAGRRTSRRRSMRREKKTLTSLMQSLPESARDRLLALAQRWGAARTFRREHHGHHSTR